MKIGVFAKAESDPQGQYTRAVRERITARGYIIVQENENADAWISLGGDGTMLRAVRQAKGAPVLGINLGNIGYLTDTDKENGLEAVNALLDGHYTVQQRMMLTTGTHTALNDVVIKGNRLTCFNITIENNKIAEVRADGLIIATPTGSTAYNRSAGGPILLPNSNLFALTPICPMDAQARSWAVPAEGEIAIRANRAVSIELDGEETATLPAGESLTVRKAQQSAQIIKTNK